MKQPPIGSLIDWVSHQRWFSPPLPTAAASITEIVAMAVEDGLEVGWWMLPLDESGAQLLLPMACCRGAAPVPGALRSGELSWFDALSHPTTAAHALEMLDGHRPRGLEAVYCDDEPLVLSALDTAPLDQSNTTVRTAGHVLKVFRSLREGRNPEIEIGEALRNAGSTHIAPLSGWASLRTEHATFDMLTVHRRIRGTDGFALAVTDADLFARGADELHFPGAAYELGIALGAVHAELSTAFGEQVVTGYGAELAKRLLTRLEALRDVEVLEQYRSAAAAIFANLSSVSAPVPVQRIHGDLHLGQTLFADDGWRLIDFEGEPRRPFAERTAPDTPMRDIAGMLRSFDYAARWSSTAGTTDDQWAPRTAAMFLEGYQLQRPDTVLPELLDALVLDKALYEVGYEAAYRPERLRIPLAAVAAVCGNS